MKRILLNSIVLLFLCINGQSQNLTPHVYIYKDKKNNTKESIIKMAKLNISDTSFIIESFTYVITGKKNNGVSSPVFSVNKGNKFCEHLLDELNKYQSSKSSLFITDVIIHHSRKNNEASRKLAQSLNLDL